MCVSFANSAPKVGERNGTDSDQWTENSNQTMLPRTDICRNGE